MSTTRERLVTTAADLFYKHGFQAVGLDQVLDEVGITKTAFYKHFESKDQLIVAALEYRDRVDTGEWMSFMLRQGREEPRAQLLSIFDMLHEWFADPEFRGCLFMNATTEFPSPNDPIHQTAAKHGANIAAELLRLARLAGASAPEALADQLMLLIAGAITARHAGKKHDAALTARAAAEMLVGMYCGQREPARV